MPLPGRPAVVALSAAVLLTVALVGVGTALAGEEAAPDDDFRTTPLEDFDTSNVVVARAAFCDKIDPRQVSAAIGGEPDREQSWENGDRIELPSGERDVVHEFGCEYIAADGTTARAWVFAPPVDEQRAKRLVKAAVATDGCEDAGGPAFGDPSVNLDCSLTVMSTSFQGLFGDAWLTCELSTPNPDIDSTELSDRAGRWCVGVAQAASS